MRSSTVSSRQHHGVDERLVDVARADRVGQRGAVDARRARASRGRARRAGEPVGRAEREPVGDDEALEAPLAAQDAGQQRLVLGAVAAVEPVVGGHQPERAALADGELERHEVELAQRALVDHRGHRVAVELGLVADEVLGRGGDVLRDCTPRTYAAAARPASSGSSE